MAFDSDANLIINTGTGDNIGATIGTDFVNDQHHQLFKLGFGPSDEFTRVGDGQDVNSSPVPSRLYQSGSGEAITSTPFSGNHAMDVNVRGLSGAGNVSVNLVDGLSGANSLQIQGASSGYPISITMDAPLPIEGSLTATLSGSTVGVTNENTAALYVQPKTGVVFPVSGSLSASVDQIGGGTLSVQGFTGMTPLVVTGDVIATLASGGDFNIASIVAGATVGITANNLDIRGLTTNRDSVKVKGFGAGDSVKTILGFDNTGAFTALGICTANNSLNVNIAGLSSLSVTADISSLSDLTINNAMNNAVPIQGSTVDALPVFVSGTAGSAYPIGITCETPVSVDVVTLPNVAGSVEITNKGLTLDGGTLDSIVSAGVTNAAAGALYVQPRAGATFGVTGDVHATIQGIATGVTIGIGGNGLGSGVTVGITVGVGGLDVRGLTAHNSKDSVKVFGSGVTSPTVGQPVFLMGVSAGGNATPQAEGHVFEHVGSSGGHLLTHVVNPLSLSGNLTISNTSIGISSVESGAVIGVTNDNESALYIQLKKGATLASSVTGDIGVGIGGITAEHHSIGVADPTRRTVATDGAIGTMLMGFTGGVTANYEEPVYQGTVRALGATAELIRSEIETLADNVASESTLGDVKGLLGGDETDPFLASLKDFFKSVLAADPGSNPNANVTTVQADIQNIEMPAVGYVKTFDLTGSNPALDSFVCKRGVRIKCEDGTSTGGMRVGFTSPAEGSNADTTTILGFLLTVGEEIFVEIDNLNKLEIARCGDDLNFTVICT
jgi:hypothetical protein